MHVYDYEDYKKFVSDWVALQPRKGYGQFKKIADKLGVHSVVVSQVFKGERELSLEQACELAQFLGMNNAETDYFLLLVQLGRSGSHELTQTIKRQLNEQKKKIKSLKNRIQHKEFSEEKKAEFYSQWFYSAIRIATNIAEVNSIDEIVNRVPIDRNTAAKVLTFLIDNGLVIEKEKKLDVGPKVTHVGHDSPLVYRHHSNWRLKGMQALENVDNDKDLFYTGPMALSYSASEKIRKILVNCIDDGTKLAASSKAQTLKCLNIDWFSIHR